MMMVERGHMRISLRQLRHDVTALLKFMIPRVRLQRQSETHFDSQILLPNLLPRKSPSSDLVKSAS